MKKFISMLSVVMAIASVSFVSCSSNDDDVIKTIDPVVSSRDFSSVKATYSCQLTEATLKVATVVVSYTNEDGKAVKETISTPKWEKTVTINKPAAECGLQLFVSKLSDPDEDVSIGLKSVAVSMVTYDQNGKELSSLNKPAFRLSTIGPDTKLDEFFALYADAPYYKMSASFDKDGRITEN